VADLKPAKEYWQELLDLKIFLIEVFTDPDDWDDTKQPIEKRIKGE
jgi:hypothetical protein